MYPGRYATERADQPAFIMASTGEQVSYAELEARSNLLAHLLRAHGLQRLDHYSIFMENNNRYLEACVAGERTGLYYTCVNSYLMPDELAFILNNSRLKALITSKANHAVAARALPQCPDVKLLLIVDGGEEHAPFVNLDDAAETFPATPLP